MRARAFLGLAVLAALPGPGWAEGPAFHTEPSSTGEHAVIAEQWRHQEGDFFGFVVLVDRVGSSGRQRQRYSVQCEGSDSARPGVWRGRGSAIEIVLVQAGQTPAAGERFAYNLWWAVCRRMLQRY